MKGMWRFDMNSAPSLVSALASGLCAYATNVPKVGPPATLWLRLCDGRTIRVGVEMHNLTGWEEIGTLTFEIVEEVDVPHMTPLSPSWSNVRAIQKLVYMSDECDAECGFVLCTKSGDQLVVLPGADVYTLAIQAPFYPQPFKPENDLTAYLRKEF